eukprot:TRINITY_DN76_c0_g1_i1.p1 TRINITY_DN76_c0_g1~~TRINITY_DN76_c0_g1_i1.p1  ORF type:complete len:447 (+),score=45.51 TRINITY_DN76_c0_g1_i1:75-1415(+)
MNNRTISQNRGKTTNMGCGEGACTGGKKLPPKIAAPAKVHHTSHQKDPKPKKLCLGPAFSEQELFNSDPLILYSDEMACITSKWETMSRTSLHPDRAIDTEEGLYNYFTMNTVKFLKRLKKGPPPKYRWTAWKVALHVREVFVEGTYQSLISPETKSKAKWLTSIKADTCRTFSEQFVSTKPEERAYMEQKLENVLVAISLYCPSIGYCQGINYIVAFMLFVSGMQEEEVFWAFVALTKEKLDHDPYNICGIDGVYIDKFPRTRFFLRCFNAMLAETNPALKAHLDEVQFPDMLWVHKWIFVLFLLSFPFSHCIRFWDYFLSYGLSAIFKISLAILAHLEGKLRGKDFGECHALFNSLKAGENLPKAEEIIAAAEKIELNPTIIFNSGNIRENSTASSLNKANKKPVEENIEEVEEGDIADEAEVGNINYTEVNAVTSKIEITEHV